MKFEIRESISNEIKSEIVKLDRSNLASVLEAINDSFDDNTRLSSLDVSGHVYILAYDDNFSPRRLVAYLECGPIPNETRRWWIYSVQILRDYRGGPLFAKMIARLSEVLRHKDFDSIHFVIHKINRNSLSLYKKIGFFVASDDYSMFSYAVAGHRRVFDSSYFKKFRSRWID